MRQNLGSGLCLTQCCAIGRPRLSGRVGGPEGLGRGRYGRGCMGGGVWEGVYGVVQGVWLRAGLGVDRDWDTDGLGYGMGCMGCGKREGMQAGQGLGYGWVVIRVGWGTGWGVWVGRDWGGDTGGLGCVGSGYGRFGGEDRKWGNVTKDFSRVGIDWLGLGLVGIEVKV